MRALCGIVAVLGLFLSLESGVAHAQCDPFGDPDATPLGATPWRGSSFLFSQALGSSTFSKSSTLSYDPYYALTFDLCLQWYLRTTFKASIEQTMAVELTDSNSTQTRREPVFGDTSLRFDARVLTHHFGPKRYAGWDAGLELLAPTSPASRAASTIAGARVRTGAKIVTDDALSSTLSVLEISYLRRFSRRNTVEAEEPYPCLAGTFASIECTQLPSATNLLDSFVAKLQFDAELFENFWFEFVGSLQWDRAHTLDDATFQTSTGAEVTLPDQSTTHFRNSRKLLFGIIYEVTPYFLLELSTTSAFPERNLDGSLRGPFRVSDTTFGLDAWFDLEGVYAAAK